MGTVVPGRSAQALPSTGRAAESAGALERRHAPFRLSSNHRQRPPRHAVLVGRFQVAPERFAVALAC
jgi:hypothetical protein